MAKKQRQNHSKIDQQPSEKTPSTHKKTTVSGHSALKSTNGSASNNFKSSKKSVSFDETLNTVKQVRPVYKKLDFYDESQDNVEDSFESDEGYSDSDEFSDLDGPDQPKTAAEVFEALKRKKLGLDVAKLAQKLKKKVGSVQKGDTKRPKTAKEIMEDLQNSKQSTGTKDESNSDNSNDSLDFSGDSEEISDLEGEDQPKTPAEVFEALKKAKLNGGNKNKNEEEKKIAKKIDVKNRPKTAKEIMDELNGKSDKNDAEEDDFSDFSGDSDEISDLEGPDQPQTAEDVFAALKRAKLGKKTGIDDSKKTLRAKEEIKSKQKSKKEYATPSFLAEDMKKDEEEMKYYAKKLGLKGMKLKKADDDDLIGGLFDGLDFIDEYTPGGGHSDFDDEPNDQSEENSEFEGEHEDEEHVVPQAPNVRENPYLPAVAPIAPAILDSGQPRRYVPPALRKVQLTEDEQERVKIQRSIKGQLNKLSEVNLLVIANEINTLYFDNPRQLINEILTKIILESIYLQSRLLDSFVVLHAALVAAIYRLQGVEFLVYFSQTLVENFESYYQRNKDDKKKESSNLLSLLTFCYTLQVVNCNLIYDIIRVLIGDLNEYNSELLLRMMKNTGSQLRSDDPLALKEIVALMYESTKGKKLTPRTEFLIESIDNLKNNKTKKNEASSENTIQLITKMKKYLGTINNNKIHDPLTITLDDIHNIDKRGKWWLTGSAWKGKDVTNETSNLNADDKLVFENVNEEAISDILDSSEPNWVELAKAHRMNNDIRRAIFISIMSSDDYIDAFTKLDKLRLKRSQQREIPSILLHCQQIEPGFNKFYGLLASKLCTGHNFRKSFQFCLWNLIKELNNEDDLEDNSDGLDDVNDAFKTRIKNNLDDESETEDVKLQKLVNSAKIYGFMMSVGSLQLNLFRVVNFLTLNEDTRLFLEIFFITFFEEIIKKSEGSKSDVSQAKRDTFNDTTLQHRFEKIADPILLKGVQLFLKKRVKNSTFMKKKYQKRIHWGIDRICEIKID